MLQDRDFEDVYDALDHGLDGKTSRGQDSADTRRTCSAHNDSRPMTFIRTASRSQWPVYARHTCVEWSGEE